MRFLPIIGALLVGTTALAATGDDTLVEKPFDKLSDRDVSEWGEAALKISAAKWKHGETKHFVIHFFKGGQKVATRAENFYTEIRTFFGNPGDLLQGKKSHIYAFFTAADWEQFAPLTNLRNIAGVTRQHEFFYIASKDGTHFDYDAKVQAHEMTHLVFNRFFEGNLPLWLNEGVAEYFGQRKTSTTSEFRRLMGAAPDYDLEALFTATQYPDAPHEVQAFYAESSIVVDFLTYTADRRPLLPKLVTAMLEHGDFEQALAVYGYKDLAAFKAAYAKFRKTRYK